MRNDCSRRTWLQTVMVAAGMAVIPAAAQQFPAYKVPHMADGHPDLNGIWQAFVTADWDLQDHEAQAGPHPETMGAFGAGPAGQSVVEGGDIPYKPEALEKKKQNFEKRMTVDVSNNRKWHDSGTPKTLLRRGFTRDSLKPGTEIIVDGYQSKDGSLRANGRDATLPDGKTLFLRSSAPDGADDKK